MANEIRHGISAFSQFFWLSYSEELFQNSPQLDIGHQRKTQLSKSEFYERETLKLRCTLHSVIPEVLWNMLKVPDFAQTMRCVGEIKTGKNAAENTQV